MTPSEQAIQLFEKYLAVHTTLHCKKGCITIDSIGNESAIRCALIAVDEILDVLYNNMRSFESTYKIGADEYWEEVKQEIEKL